MSVSEITRPKFSPYTLGLGLATWTRRAVFHCASTDETRQALHGVYMDPEFQMAVSSDGHRLFASRADYRPELAGKVLKKRPWLMRDEPEFHPQVFPEWQQVLPTWAPEQLGRLRFRVPLGLAEFGREVILNLSEDRALFTREDEKPTCDRRIRAEKLAPIEGCEIAALWCHTDTVTQLTGATVFVPNQSETWMSPDFLKKQPWFMVVMPLRDLV